MARPKRRTSFNILGARAKGSGSPFTRSKAMFFYQLQACVLILGGMGTTVAVGPGGALETDPQRVRFSGILPGFDPLQKGGSAPASVHRRWVGWSPARSTGGRLRFKSEFRGCREVIPVISFWESFSGGGSLWLSRWIPGDSPCGRQPRRRRASGRSSRRP